MKFEVSLAFCGERFNAEAFFIKAGVLDARVGVTGHLGAQVRPDLVKREFVWESPYFPCSSPTIGLDVKKLLLKYENILPMLDEEDKAYVSCVVTIVGYYLENEEPKNFFFDAETVALLGKFSANIGIDMCHDLS